MTIKTRRIIFIFFIFSFVIITSLTTLYAAGYKINFSWPFKFNQTLQKTGMLIIDSEPGGAKIYLNDKPQQLFFKKIYSPDASFITTSAKIKNILPGNYNIRLELDGYWPWQKKLEIKPGESTFAEDIYLFKNDLPIKLTDARNISGLAASPDNKKIAYLDENKIYIYNLENDSKFAAPLNLSSLASGTEDIVWSADSKKILLKNIIIDAANPDNIVFLEKLTGPDSDNFKFNSGDANKILFQKPDSINSIDLNGNIENKIIAGEHYQDYLLQNDYLYYVSGFNRSYKLKTSALKTGELTREIDLPTSDGYKLLDRDSKYLNLYDEANKILYLVDPLSSINPLREVISDLSRFKWVNDKILIYANSFEVWYFNLEENNKTLLTRLSQPIGGVIWHPSNNYIIFSTDKCLNVIELDRREKRNITELTKLDSIYSPSLDKKGDILYFGAKIGSQEGIYKLTIQ